MLDDVKRSVAILRAGRFKHPVKVRMHPLDIREVARKYGGDGEAIATKIVGAEVQMDCGVPRGRPVAEYGE